MRNGLRANGERRKLSPRWVDLDRLESLGGGHEAKMATESGHGDEESRLESAVEGRAGVGGEKKF